MILALIITAAVLGYIVCGVLTSAILGRAGEDSEASIGLGMFWPAAAAAFALLGFCVLLSLPFRRAFEWGERRAR